MLPELREIDFSVTVLVYTLEQVLPLFCLHGLGLLLAVPEAAARELLLEVPDRDHPVPVCVEDTEDIPEVLLIAEQTVSVRGGCDKLIEPERPVLVNVEALDQLVPVGFLLSGLAEFSVEGVFDFFGAGSELFSREVARLGCIQLQEEFPEEGMFLLLLLELAQERDHAALEDGGFFEIVDIESDLDSLLFVHRLLFHHGLDPRVVKELLSCCSA